MCCRGYSSRNAVYASTIVDETVGYTHFDGLFVLTDKPIRRYLMATLGLPWRASSVPGFIDKQAPSPEAEYVRFLEGDVFGKLILKSYLLRVIGLNESDIRIPIGKWGDMDSESHGLADASVRIHDRWLAVEVKLARLNIANKTKGQTEPNWAFNNILRSPSKAAKQYDILFAVGVNVLGFENPSYWEYFRNTVSTLSGHDPALTEGVRIFV